MKIYAPDEKFEAILEFAKRLSTSATLQVSQMKQVKWVN